MRSLGRFQPAFNFIKQTSPAKFREKGGALILFRHLTEIVDGQRRGSRHVCRIAQRGGSDGLGTLGGTTQRPGLL